MKVCDNCQLQIGDFICFRQLNENDTDILNVYLAENTKNEKLYIIKGISIDYLIKENIMTNLEKAIKSLSSLKNNNIVNVKGTRTSTSNDYIITEFCNGNTLNDFLKYYIRENNKSFNEKFIQKALNQIISGLESIIDNKNINDIIYKDIGLENIFINFDKYKNIIINGKLPEKINYSCINIDEDSLSFKIGIFNSNTVKNLKSGGSSKIEGNPKYLPPELAKGGDAGGAKYQDIKKCIWELGIITYELLIGKEPFKGNTKDDICNKIIEGKYNLPKNLKASTEIIKFINELLKYEPKKRLDLSQIKENPFLKNNVDTFHFIELDKTIEVNTKDSENELYLLLCSKDGKDSNFLGEVKKKLEEEVGKKIPDENLENMKKGKNNEKENQYLYDIIKGTNDYIDEKEKEKEKIENDIKLKELEINELKEQIMKLKLENENNIKDYEKNLSETKNMINDLDEDEKEKDIKNMNLFFIKKKRNDQNQKKEQ